MAGDYVFTSESVTEGHPDKLCDQISDALVGAHLRQDPLARIVAECAVSTGILFVSVKSSSTAVVDVPNTVRAVILDAGYDQGSFDGRTCTVMTNINETPVDKQRLDEAEMDSEQLDRLVAQENVTVFGYACAQTPELMPLPISLAHRLVRQMDGARRKKLKYLAPDGKCQVGVTYRGHQPRRIDSITLVASQDKADHPSLSKLRKDLLTCVIEPIFEGEEIGLDKRTRVNINPEGAVIEGGPAVHAGLTGRKNDMDTYGGYSRHGGSALSGKDPTRIDRVGAYAARHVAKNIVAAGLAQRCEVQLSYSIGIAAPVSLYVDTFGTGRLSEEKLIEQVHACFDFRLGCIIRDYGLRKLARRKDGRLFRRLAVYGHVGREDLKLPWEQLDHVEALE